MVNRWQIVSQTTGPADFKCLHVKKRESVWHLSFQEERLNLNWNGSLGSSIGKSARLVIWRFKVRIPVQVQIFLLKSKFYYLFTCLFYIFKNLPNSALAVSSSTHTTELLIRWRNLKADIGPRISDHFQLIMKWLKSMLACVAREVCQLSDSWL